MTSRTYPRVSEPHIESIVEAVRPHLAVANAGGFFVSWADGVVIIEQGGWANVDDIAVQAVVDAAPTKNAVIAAEIAERLEAMSLKLPSFAEIDNIVEQVFSNHTVAQRTVLKRVFKLVRVVWDRG